MDLIGVMRACVLRWWVVLPLLALTAWLCADQYRSATPQYTSTGVMVIAPSEALIYTRGAQTETGVVVTSPFNGGDGPRVVAGLTARALNTGTVRDALLPGGGAALQATREVTEDSNVINLTVVADDAAVAQKGMEAVLSGTDAVVEDVQRTAGVRDGQFLAAYRGGPVDPPTVAYPDRVRGVVGFALAGALLAVVLAVLVQSLLEGRARRRASSARQAGAPPAHQAVASDLALGDVGRPERAGRRTPRAKGGRSKRSDAEPHSTQEIDLEHAGSAHRW